MTSADVAGTLGIGCGFAGWWMQDEGVKRMRSPEWSGGRLIKVGRSGGSSDRSVLRGSTGEVVAGKVSVVFGPESPRGCRKGRWLDVWCSHCRLLVQMASAAWRKRMHDDGGGCQFVQEVVGWWP
jgi:hypothetical protein